MSIRQPGKKLSAFGCPFRLTILMLDALET
jgi:hypothetical protein